MKLLVTTSPPCLYVERIRISAKYCYIVRSKPLRHILPSSAKFTEQHLYKLWN